jgi:hypothetical protein
VSLTQIFMPPQGNPMRPVILLLEVFFALMLVAFPILMYAVGLGMSNVILMAVIVLVTAAVCIGSVGWMSRGIERDRVRLEATDALATWWLSVDEFTRFAASERRRNGLWAAGYLVFGLAVAAFFAIWLDDMITAAVIAVAFLLAAGVKFFLGGPPLRATDEAREVRIGPRGVQALGRYTPFQATLTRLRSVDLDPGDPAVITFWVRSGRQWVDLRVPVTQGRWDDAEAIVAEFRKALEATS